MTDADVEDEAAADESEGSDDEEPMEINGKTALSDVPMETNNNDGEKNTISVKAATTDAKSAAVSIAGLPQSKEELESLISTIHQTVNDSVLPRLHRCLNAKVMFAHKDAICSEL